MSCAPPSARHAYQRLAIRNHGERLVDVRLTLQFDSDFADLFEAFVDCGGSGAGSPAAG